MKKRLIGALALSLLSSLTLVGCGENNDTQTDQITIEISGETSCYVGKTAILEAIVTNSSSKAKFTSSDEKVATVSSLGLVRGISVGTCTITATLVDNEEISASIQFEVLDNSASFTLTINTSKTSCKEGEEITLECVVDGKDDTDATYKWTSEKRLGSFANSKLKEVTYTANYEGVDTITVTCTIGNETATQSIEIEVVGVYVEISTKAEFEENILVSGTASGKYALVNDIDLEGLKIDGCGSGRTFAGILDGRGHKLTNFEIISSTNGGSARYSNSGMFSKVDTSGIIKNVEFYGTFNEEGVGWGTGLLSCEFSGELENCLLDITCNYDCSSDSWFPFNGGICGVLKESAVCDGVVLNVNGDGAGCVMAVTAYPAGGSHSDGTNSGFSASTQSFKLSNIYSNKDDAGTLGSDWEWGCAIEDSSGVKTSVDYSSTLASYYTLDTSSWNLVDNEMPHLIAK